MTQATKLKFNSIYECYPLYAFLYGGSPVGKLVESIANVQIMGRHLHDCNINSAGLTAFEFACGESPHRDYTLNAAAAAGMHFCKYVENELYPPEDCGSTVNPVGYVLPPTKASAKYKGHDFMFGDITDPKLVKAAGTYNFVLGNFFAVSSLVDQSTKAFHRLLDSLIALANPDNGAVLLDVHPDPDAHVYSCLASSALAEARVYPVPLGHALRSLVGFPKYAPDVKLTAATHSTYNRLTNTVVDELYDVYVECGKKKVRLEFKQPFSQRVRSIPEILDYVVTKYEDTVWAKFYRYDYDSKVQGDLVDVTELPAYQTCDTDTYLDFADVPAHAESLRPNKLMLVRK